MKIEDDIYSRCHFCFFPVETIKDLTSIKVLIMGMRGLGAETAKNIILNGPKEVDIFDETIVSIKDLGSNFFLSEEDVGKKRRDEACLEKLSKLNPNVKVGIFNVEKKNNIEELVGFFSDKIRKYNVVVITELFPFYFIDKINQACRNNNIKFIYGICLGLAGYIFSYFGERHTIYDETGKEIKTYSVTNITKDKEGLVTIDTIEGTNNFDLDNDDYVIFKEVEGMTELNHGYNGYKEFKITYVDNKSFKIGDTSNFGDYKKGGFVYQIKKPKCIIHYDFSTRGMMICDRFHPLENKDDSKKGRSELLYMALIGVHDFFIKNNFILPELNNMEQAKSILDDVKNFYNKAKENKFPCYENIQDFDEKIVLNVIRWSAANITPVCSFFGGIISQEIIKSTGRYSPIDQWLILDFFEVVENLGENIDRTLLNCRYDDQIAIFGNEIQKKMQESNIFMIGANNTGSEFLKNLAMMGFCTSTEKKFVVADDDIIKKNDLNHQFLFKKEDNGKSKAEIAIESIQEMNPSFKAKGLNIKVGEDTEDIFTEEFWSKQDFIICATNSIGTKKYIDNKVIFHEKIAVDCETLDLKAQSYIIIPHKTMTYGDRIPYNIKTEIPKSILEYFPSLIEHCIEWSKNSFIYYFEKSINEVKIFFNNFNEFKDLIKKEGNASNQLNKLEYLKKLIDIFITKEFQKIIRLSFDCYIINFVHNIQQLLKEYPPDYKIEINNKKVDFWTGSKRLPHPIQFYSDYYFCFDYIYNFVKILSHVFSIQLSKEQLNRDNIERICSEFQIPEFVNNNYSEEESKKKIDEIMKELEKIKRDDYDISKIFPKQLEEGNIENGHLDFIHAGANIRAMNYRINECDKKTTKKLVSGENKINLNSIASIVGIASLQLYTTFQTSEIKFFRECSFDLSSNDYYFSPPYEAIKTFDKMPDCVNDAYKAIPEGWTNWDRIEVKGSKTCNELVQFLENQYKFIVKFIFIDNIILNDKSKEVEENKNLKIEDLYEKLTGKLITESKKYLLLKVVAIISKTEINGKNYKNVKVKFPIINYIFKNN